LSGNTKPEGQIDGGWFIMAVPHEGYEQIPKGIKIYLFPLSQLFQLLQTGQDYDNILSVNHYIEAYAHSIRNPLNSLKGAVHYLKQKFKDLEGADSFIQIADEEIKRLDDLTLNFIQNLLEHPRTTQTDINSIIAKFQTILSFKLKDDQVRFSVDYGDIPTVLINPFELEQAISNILNNAIKAVSSGGTIKLETFTRELENRRYAVIKVTDSGCGFEPSSSDSSLVQAESTGSGFGLKITRRILRRYGGRLDIKSQPNRGTTAALLLPVS
jgi:signal transduction histidine kinase